MMYLLRDMYGEIISTLGLFLILVASKKKKIQAVFLIPFYKVDLSASLLSVAPDRVLHPVA